MVIHQVPRDGAELLAVPLHLQDGGLDALQQLLILLEEEGDGTALSRDLTRVRGSALAAATFTSFLDPPTPTSPYPSPPGELPGRLARGRPRQDGVHQLLELLVAPQQLPELRPDVGAADGALGRHRLRASGAAGGGRVRPRAAQQRPQLVQLETGRGNRLSAGAPKPPGRCGGPSWPGGSRGDVAPRGPPPAPHLLLQVPGRGGHQLLQRGLGRILLLPQLPQLRPQLLQQGPGRREGARAGSAAKRGGPSPRNQAAPSPPGWQPLSHALTPGCGQISPRLQPAPALRGRPAAA